MNASQPWQDLFVTAAPDEPTRDLPMRLLRRGGAPFLLLPSSARAAALGLDLYAAQTLKARVAKASLRLALRCGCLPRGAEKITLRLAARDPLGRFMSELAGTDFPQFAMLAGNPNTEGQRCIFLLFNSKAMPAGIVKAGGGPRAVQLIEREEKFLKAVPPGTPAIPKLRSAFQSDRVRAFAIDFFRGRSPRMDDWTPAQQILGAWVKPAPPVPIADLPVWKRLLTAAAAGLSPMTRGLGAAKVRPCIYHGDFVPWNIKAHHGAWTLLDWERGELSGMPLWDWLHFIIQPAILVQRAGPLQIIKKIAEFFRSPLFADYAQRAQIAGLQVPLTVAYLDYSVHVTAQSEGLEVVGNLLDLAQKTWSVPPSVTIKM